MFFTKYICCPGIDSASELHKIHHTTNHALYAIASVASIFEIREENKKRVDLNAGPKLSPGLLKGARTVLKIMNTL
jgi:hypothetical protein